MKCSKCGTNYWAWYGRSCPKCKHMNTSDASVIARDTTAPTVDLDSVTDVVGGVSNLIHHANINAISKIDTLPDLPLERPEPHHYPSHTDASPGHSSHSFDSSPSHHSTNDSSHSSLDSGSSHHDSGSSYDSGSSFDSGGCDSSHH